MQVFKHVQELLTREITEPFNHGTRGLPSVHDTLQLYTLMVNRMIFVRGEPLSDAGIM